MEKKRKYRELCSVDCSIPVFCKDWWLDCVADGSWDVVLVEEGHEIVAAMPYVSRKRFGFVGVVMPPLTQFLGPWMKVKNEKSCKILEKQKKLMGILIDGLPKFDYFKQHWNYEYKNWLPFYWRNFSQTTRYTYVLNDISDKEKIWSGFDRSKKKNIKRAKDIVNVVYNINAERFYYEHRDTLRSDGKVISYSKDLFMRLHEAVVSNNAGQIIAAFDENSNLHSALFIVWDEISAFNLVSVIKPEFRKSGSASLLIQSAIELASEHTNRFDFEGSMIESVERSFRRFGAEQYRYFAIEKVPSKIVRMYRFLRNDLFKQ